MKYVRPIAQLHSHHAATDNDTFSHSLIQQPEVDKTDIYIKLQRHLTTDYGLNSVQVPDKSALGNAHPSSLKITDHRKPKFKILF